MGDDEYNNVFDDDDDDDSDDDLEPYEESQDPDADPEELDSEDAYLSDREHVELEVDDDEPEAGTEGESAQGAGMPGPTSQKPGPLTLLYRSDFLEASPHWAESDDPQLTMCREAGYWHMTLGKQSSGAISVTNHLVGDFRVSVDVLFSRKHAEESSGGLVLATGRSVYYYLMNPTGRSVSFWEATADSPEWQPLWVKNPGKPPEYQEAWNYLEGKRDRLGEISLTMQRLGNEFRLGVDGSWVMRARATSMETGRIGVALCTSERSFIADARFKDLVLYRVNPGTRPEEL